MEPILTDFEWDGEPEIDVVDVSVDVDAPELQPSYTYRVPDELLTLIDVGACVHVPFAGRETIGYVLAIRKLRSSAPLVAKLKSLLGLVEDGVRINTEQLHLARWMSEKYVCNLVDAIRCIAPTNMGARISRQILLTDCEVTSKGFPQAQARFIDILRTEGGSADSELMRKEMGKAFYGAYTALKRKSVVRDTRALARAKTVAKTVSVFSLGRAVGQLKIEGTQGSRRSPQQERILSLLAKQEAESGEPLTSADITSLTETSDATLRGLVSKGLVAQSTRSVRRAPVISPKSFTSPPNFTPSQRIATGLLRRCLQTGAQETVLLFGVTASGKTEVYLDAISQTLALGKTAIVLVPEIALTTQVLDVFIGRFGDLVAVIHSRLSEGEKHDEWRRIQSGEAKIVVGARSAVFAPIENIGLIVVDEEHEASYKQDSNPRYNARELAAERARYSHAVLLLGSATPSLESFYACVGPRKRHIRKGSESRNGDSNALPNAAKTHLVEMETRIDNRPLPTVEVVDLREEFKKRKAMFSLRLTEAIQARLAAREQIILFLNRRGYASFILCRDCGYVAKCPHCAVSLAYHSYDRTLKCHHCEYAGPAPQICPDCRSAKVKAFGLGTEKVEEEVRICFPEARVVRLDRDTTANKGEHARILNEFRTGEANILIGTQMVAKGLDFPSVTLVGVVSADTSINMPDFRAAERTFQLLTQVAGRSGRGEKPGEVIIQTFSPDHYAVQAAVSQDYRAFYEKEIIFREELKYPPFTRFANMISVDEKEKPAELRAVALAAALEKVVPEDIEIIGPSPAPITRLRGMYRFHVALKASPEAPLADYVRQAVNTFQTNQRMSIHIDMDPLSMS